MMAAGAVVACGSDSPTGIPSALTPTFVTLSSEPGDIIGAGQSYEYTLSRSAIKLIGDRSHIALTLIGDESWYAELSSPGLIVPGTYSLRDAAHPTSLVRFEWFGQGRACDATTGSFTIDTSVYRGDTLTAIDLSFEQRCAGASAALRGRIHWRIEDNAAIPTPTNPIPSDLWTPPPGTLPSSGNYLYLDGEPLAFNSPKPIQQLITQFTIAESSGHLTLQAGRMWNADLAIDFAARLPVGYYGTVQRYPFQQPPAAGMSWSGVDELGLLRRCNSVDGWFVVDRAEYVGLRMTAIDLRFEQRCDGRTQALRGVLHWRA